MSKKVLVSLTNDITTDQRVYKVCKSLQSMGFDIEIIGRLNNWSKTISRNYPIRRLKTFFSQGPLFYLEFNIRLFFQLLFKSADVLLSNDLDTLLANFLVSKIKKIPLVYDSHELFPEVPELVNRPLKKSVWEMLESWLIPRLNYSYTVCDSIAKFYNNKYGVTMKVLRNFPVREEGKAFKKSLKTIIYQGNMNPGRGLELAIQSMKYLPNFELKILGNGTVLKHLQDLAQSEGVDTQVDFLGRISFESLNSHTRQASIGILFEEPMGLSFEYSLPNKLFDYIHAETVVLATPLIEVKKIIENYNVGELLVSRDPKSVARQIKNIIANIDKYSFEKARTTLNWQNEEKVLKEIFSQFN